MSGHTWKHFLVTELWCSNVFLFLRIIGGIQSFYLPNLYEFIYLLLRLNSNIIIARDN